MKPYERLRVELERHRDRGHRFDAVWPAAISAALRDEQPRQAFWWRGVFSEQRSVWKAAYSGPNRTPTLAPADRDERVATGRDLALVGGTGLVA